LVAPGRHLALIAAISAGEHAPHGSYRVCMESAPTLNNGSWMRYGMWPLAFACFFIYLTSLCTLIPQRVFPGPFLFLVFVAVMASGWLGGWMTGQCRLPFRP
jgi:hypothetical protein